MSGYHFYSKGFLQLPLPVLQANLYTLKQGSYPVQVNRNIHTNRTVYFSFQFSILFTIPEFLYAETSITPFASHCQPMVPEDPLAKEIGRERGRCCSICSTGCGNRAFLRCKEPAACKPFSATHFEIILYAQTPLGHAEALSNTLAP